MYGNRLTKKDDWVGLPRGKGPYDGGMSPVAVFEAMLLTARHICLQLFID